MSVRLVDDPHYRTTDHNIEITAMREKAKEIVQKYPIGGEERAPESEFWKCTILMASAALLECHDATGISLDDWVGPRELVELGLTLIDLDSDEVFLKNGV